jgi:hypothetical protein
MTDKYTPLEGDVQRIDVRSPLQGIRPASLFVQLDEGTLIMVLECVDPEAGMWRVLKTCGGPPRWTTVLEPQLRDGQHYLRLS